MYLDAVALIPAVAISAAAAPVEQASLTAPPLRPPPLHAADLSVLTYNVKGLPWPIASGRAEALKAIGDELARLRAQGRQPDIVLIQEGFRGEVQALVDRSGYRYWAQGPTRFDRDWAPEPQAAQSFRLARLPFAGEAFGKVVGAGLHVLSDRPITEVRGAPFRYCAGLDCLANKGVMLARIEVPGLGPIDVVNTHMNSRRASKAPRARTLAAHKLQTEELLGFLADNRSPGAPLLVGGDFNVKNAPERYDHRAAARPYRVVAEHCADPASGCEGQSTAVRTPWLMSQDLQAFAGAEGVAMQPVKVETGFGRGLSDHDGYLVRYRLSWDPTASAARPASAVQISARKLGVKVAYRY